MLILSIQNNDYGYVNLKSKNVLTELNENENLNYFHKDELSYKKNINEKEDLNSGLIFRGFCVLLFNGYQLPSNRIVLKKINLNPEKGYNENSGRETVKSDDINQSLSKRSVDLELDGNKRHNSDKMNKKNDKICTAIPNRFKPEIRTNHDSTVQSKELENHSYFVVVNPKNVNSNRIMSKNISTDENKNFDVYDFAEDSDDNITDFKEVVTLNKNLVNKRNNNLGTDIVRNKDKTEVRLLQNYVTGHESNPLSITRDSVNGRSRENFSQECIYNIKHGSEKQVPDPNTIIPKKTIDITKIKGWRKKQFTVEKCLSNMNSVLKKTNILKKLNESGEQIIESGIMRDKIIEKDRIKDYTFVCDELDDFLDQEAELKINYEIPHLYAEYGIKLTSEELVSRPKFNISSVNSRLSVESKIVPAEKSATVSFVSPTKLTIHEKSSGLIKKPSPKIKNVKTKSPSNYSVPKENCISRGKPMHILEKKVKADIPVFVTQSGRRSGKLQQTPENKSNGGSRSGLGIHKNTFTIVSTLKPAKDLPKSVSESFTDYKLQIRKFGMVLYPGPTEPLNPFITYHLQKLRSHRTVIDKKWANFAVSAVVQKDTPIVRKRMVLPLTCCFKIKKDASENLPQNFIRKINPIIKTLDPVVTDSTAGIEVAATGELLNEDNQDNSFLCGREINEKKIDVNVEDPAMNVTAADGKLNKILHKKVNEENSSICGKEVTEKIKIGDKKKVIKVTNIIDTSVDVKISVSDKNGETGITQESNFVSSKEILENTTITDKKKETKGLNINDSTILIKTVSTEKKLDKDIEKKVHQDINSISEKDNIEKAKIVDKKKDQKDIIKKDSLSDIKITTSDKQMDKNGEKKTNQVISSISGKEILENIKIVDKKKEPKDLNKEDSSTGITITIPVKKLDKNGEKRVNQVISSICGKEILEKIKIIDKKKEPKYLNMKDSSSDIKIITEDKKKNKNGEKKRNQNSSSIGKNDSIKKIKIFDKKKELKGPSTKNSPIDIKITPADKHMEKNREKRVNQDSNSISGKDNIEKIKIIDKKKESKNVNMKDSSTDIKMTTTADKQMDKNIEKKTNQVIGSVSGKEVLERTKLVDKKKEPKNLIMKDSSTDVTIIIPDKKIDKNGEKKRNQDFNSICEKEIIEKTKIADKNMVVSKKKESTTQSDLTKKINETKFDLYEEEVKCLYNSTDEIDMINCKSIDNFSDFSDNFSDDSNFSSSNSHIVFEKRKVKTSIGQCIEENMRNYPEVIDVEDDGTEFSSTVGLSQTPRENTYQKLIGNLLTKKLNVLKQTGIVATSIDNLKSVRPNALELIKLNFIKENYQTGYINLWYLKSPDSGKSRVFLTFSMNPPVERAKNLKMISRHKITNPPNIILEIITKEKFFDTNDFAILYCNGKHWEIHGSVNFVVNKLDGGKEENEKIQVFHLTHRNFTELEMLHNIKRRNDKNKVVKWWVMHMMQEYNEITIRCGDQVGRISRSIIIKTWKTKVPSFIEFKGLRNIRPIGVGVNPRLWPYFLIGPYHVEDHHNLTLRVNAKIVPFDYFVPADRINPAFLLKRFITSVIMHSWRNNRRIVAMWLYDRIATDRGSFIQVRTRLKKPGSYGGLIEHDYSRSKPEDGPYQPKPENREKVVHPPAAASSSLSLPAPSSPPPIPPVPSPSTISNPPAPNITPSSSIPSQPPAEKKPNPTQRIFLVPNVPNLGYIKGELQPDKSITIKHPLKPERKRNSHRIGDWLNRIMKKRIKFVPSNFCVKWKIVKKAKLVRNLEPLNRSTLGGTHILCKKGVFYLLSLTKEKIAKLGLNEAVVMNAILNNPIIKEVTEMKELGKMLLNKETCDLPMADILRMALVEIEKLEEEEKRLKCWRLAVEKEREILCRKYLDVLDESDLDANSKRTINFYVTGILQSCETADGKFGDPKRERENLQRLEAINKFLLGGTSLAPMKDFEKTDSHSPIMNEKEKPQVESNSDKDLSSGLNTVDSPVQETTRLDNEKFGELESKIRSLHESLNKMVQDDASLRELLTNKLNAMSKHLEKMKRNRNTNGKISPIINEKIDSSEGSHCQNSSQLSFPTFENNITLREKDFVTEGVSKIITKRKSSGTKMSMTEDIIKIKTRVALTRLKKYVLEDETSEIGVMNKNDESEDKSSEHMSVILRELEQIGMERRNLELENSARQDKLNKPKERKTKMVSCLKTSRDSSNHSERNITKIRKRVRFEVMEPIYIKETKTEKKLKRQLATVLANGKEVFVVNKKRKNEEDCNFGKKLRTS